LLSSSKFSSWLMKVEIESPPKQLRQTSLGQFLVIITRCCKFSFSSLDWQRLVITLAIIKILSVSIWHSTIPSTWCAKKETFRNGVSCVAHHKRGFTASYGLTCKRWKKWNLFFIIKKITSSFRNILTKEILLLVIDYLANLYIKMV
jgi:hypothetical protein